MSGGAKVQDGIEHVDSMSLGYTTLSALNLKATALETELAPNQPDSHSSQLMQDVRFQVNANSNPVSGFNESNPTLRTGPDSCNGQSGGGQDGGPLAGAVGNHRQSQELKLSREGRKFSKIDNLLNDSRAGLLKVQKDPNSAKDTFNQEIEEALQALQTVQALVTQGANTSSVEDVRSLVKNILLNLSGYATRKRARPVDASVTEPVGSKRKVSCGFCPKELDRECDLKYMTPFVIWCDSLRR